MKWSVGAALGWLLMAPVQPVAFAQVKMSGMFTAGKTCPAFTSLKKNSNPENLFVRPGKAYRLLGKNRAEATHYFIEIPGVAQPQRWVSVSCGSISDSAVSADAPETGAAVDTDRGTVKPKPRPKRPRGGEAFYVLALSWQPAFCEENRRKTECKAQTESSFEATHFALHGLWPQPRRNAFCGVSRRDAASDDVHDWAALPAPDLSAETRAALARAMPGTQSLLERHEWIKHGTCYGTDAETYFRDSLRLLDAINRSPVRDFMARNIGKQVKTSDIRAMFDKAFGPGAGERVRVACSRDGLISELTIGLKGDISSGTPVSELIAASSATDPGCPEGAVDAVD